MEKQMLELLRAVSNEFIIQNLKMPEQDEIELKNMKAIIDQVTSAIPGIKSNPISSRIYIYHFLIFYQQINFQLVKYHLEKDGYKELSSLLNSLSSILNQLQSESDIGETCGWEFIRFAGDRYLISRFPFSSNIQDYLLPPKEEFTSTLLPEFFQKIIDKGLESDDPTQSLQEIQDAIQNGSNEIIYLFLCDIIRYVFSVKNVSAEIKTTFIKSLLSNLLKSNQLIYTYDICLVLMIDMLSFRREMSKDDTNIHVCHNILKEYPQILEFVQNIAKRNDVMLLSLAEVSARLNEPKLFPKLTLPTVAPDTQKVDTKEALANLIRNLKWQRKQDLGTTLLSDFAASVMPNLESCVFEIPFTPNEDLQMILDTNNPRIIAAVCENSQTVLKLSMYSLCMKKALFENVLELLLNSKSNVAGTFLLPSLSRVLVIAPQLLDSVLNILPRIPEEADVIPFIRYISYNLTTDKIYEISNMSNKSPFLFPSNEAQIDSILKHSLKWRETAQNTLWLIITISINQNQATMIGFMNAVEKFLPQLAYYPVALYNIRLILQRMKPVTPFLVKITDTFMNGNEILCKTFYAILVSWYETSQEETITFLRSRPNSMKAFAANLNPEQRERLNPLIKTIMIPPKKYV